ncbi:MAG TPA: hypothetical protein VNT32_07505 [Thermoleophilaceae bacterium]|nr:hypothetical protein [Thermoleophilaceae bacterium]
MTTSTRTDLYNSVASLRTHAFELLDRVSDDGAASSEVAAAVAVRLQAVANQLGAVEALVAPHGERD